MMKNNEIVKKLKKEWLKKYILPIVCVAIVIVALFASYVFLDHFVLGLLGVMLVIASFAVFRNKLAEYIEKHIDE